MQNLTFIEIGSAHYGALRPLLDKEWHQNAQKATETGVENRFPDELLSYDGQWEGWFVEPVPGLLANLIEMHGHLKNAHFINGALAPESIFDELHVLAKGPMTGGGTLDLARGKKQTAYKVILQTFTLERLLDYLDFTPTLLFIDIEGLERTVLDTYSFSRCPDFWMVDMHQYQPAITKAVDIFQKNGYRNLTTTVLRHDELWMQKK